MVIALFIITIVVVVVSTFTILLQKRAVQRAEYRATEAEGTAIALGMRAVELADEVDRLKAAAAQTEKAHTVSVEMLYAELEGQDRGMPSWKNLESRVGRHIDTRI